MKNIRFTKLEGGGNDFILVDNRGVRGGKTGWDERSIKLCARKTGIGADGVLLLQDHRNSDFMMRIFNSDGSEAEMCGNGARCAAYYYYLETNKKKVKFITLAGIMKSSIKPGGVVNLLLPAPTGTELNRLINIEGKQMSVSFINTGVPHAVVETSRLEEIDVKKTGRQIRYNEAFAPAGTNVNFVTVKAPGLLEIRTYERGVEDETLACGTGVTASAIISALKEKTSLPVRVKTRGGLVMTVYGNISASDDLLSRVNDVRLEGHVSKVFSGETEV